MSKFVEFKGEKLSLLTNEFMEALSEKMPHLTFDYETEGYRTGKEHSTGIYHKLKVFNGKMLIGEIGHNQSYHNQSDKYYIASPNVEQGRYHYQVNMSDAKMKQSIHLKEVLKVAIKALTPLTFEQAMRDSYDNFRRAMRDFSSDKFRIISQNTNNNFKMLKDDAVDLFKQDYKFKSQELNHAIQYIAQNQEFVEKYYDYKPDYLGVWIKDDEVEYYNYTEKTMHKVADKGSLPQEILGKICMLDIMDKKKFTEDMGYKENDQIYWVLL